MAGAISASALATIISAAIGVTAAFASRGVARALLYARDLFITLPWLFLLMMVRSALPLTLAPLESAGVTFLLLALLGWPPYAGLSYARAVAVRNADWLLHARAAGLRTSQLARRHVLPHLLPLLLSQFLICIPACLVAEANLGTLGLGISEPLPSWGSMLLSLGNTAVLSGSAWVYLPVVLLVTVLILLELLVFEV
jgi:ABC-type dipeptide/oligopeptide/nickel transport system permease subunit